MNQEDVRAKLNEITDQGLKITYIGMATKIQQSELSRFKNGTVNFSEKVLKKLDDYLNRVVIPKD